MNAGNPLSVSVQLEAIIDDGYESLSQGQISEVNHLEFGILHFGKRCAY